MLLSSTPGVPLETGVPELAGRPLCTQWEIQEMRKVCSWSSDQDVGQSTVATSRILLGLELPVPIGMSSRPMHRSPLLTMCV